MAFPNMECHFKHVLILLSFHLRLRLYLKYFKSDGIQSIMGWKAVCIKLCSGENTGLHIRNPLFLLFIPYRLACRLEAPQMWDSLCYYLRLVSFAFFTCLLLMCCQINIPSCRCSFTFWSPSKQIAKKLFPSPFFYKYQVMYLNFCYYAINLFLIIFIEMWE